MRRDGLVGVDFHPHKLGGATANIKGERETCILLQQRTAAQKGQTRLFFVGDNIDMQAGFFFDAI